MLRSRLAVAERLATSLRLLLTLVFADKSRTQSVLSLRQRAEKNKQAKTERLASHLPRSAGAGQGEGRKVQNRKLNFFWLQVFAKKNLLKLGLCPKPRKKFLDSYNDILS